MAPPNWLIPPTAGWRGTLGTFMSKPDFKAYVEALDLIPFKPTVGAKVGNSPPSGAIVLHNTAAPTQAQWASHDVKDRLKNITADYRRKSPPWQAGPHLFIDWNGIWLFTPLWQQGTHSPSWNRFSWGIEMVGDYDKEPFDSGNGALVRDNSAFAVKALLSKLRLPCTMDTIRFHREDKATTHACPGKNVHKDAFIQTVLNTTL